VAVDNTFLGPVFQHPLHLGADLSVYSATKYLAGQSDILAGVVMGSDATLIASLRGMRAILGNILQPDECWILDSRLPTVELRMTRQSKNAARIVAQLATHPQVKTAYYPDLFTDPEQIRIRDEQSRFPGAVFALDLKGGRSAAFDFLRRLRIARNAVSLGGVETLACHPRTTTHSEMSSDELGRYGIGEGLVRVSIGVEDHRDLLRDFQEALDAV
jgi:cystathionine beta-lyase/cystathionine gamma-synthase